MSEPLTDRQSAILEFIRAHVRDHDYPPTIREIGKAFVEEQTRQFGTDHLYASDTFIEMSPPSNDPAFLDKLFDGVGSTRLGLTLDALNFYWYGWALDEIYGYYEKFAPRVFHTHCKSVRYPADKRNVRRPMGWEYAKYAAPIYEGDIDYKRVVAILRKANYQGDLCLENECLRHFPVEQQPGVLKKEIEMLKSLA